MSGLLAILYLQGVGAKAHYFAFASDRVRDGLLTLEDFSSDKASRWDRDKDKERKEPPLDETV